MIRFSLTTIALIGVVLQLALGFHNPGIIIQIPKNYNLPIIQAELPQYIPSIILQKLELTNVTLRDIEYSWKFNNDSFIILFRRTLVSFDWAYGRDRGIGSFVQQYSDLVINCLYSINKNNRFSVDIQGAKITNQDKRHSIKISLGGGVPETIIVEVTNLILNHAKSVFRSAIKNAIAKIVQQFTAPLRKDYEVICAQGQDLKKHCININTTLVTAPLHYDNGQIIQINGATYIDKNQSGFLDHGEPMFKVDSNLFNVQVNNQFINRFLQLYNIISPIDKIIKTTEISDVTDIDSQTLSVVFPKMMNYADPRPVLLGVHISAITSQLNQSPYFVLNLNGSLNVKTEYKSIEPYIDNSQAEAKVKIQPVINKDQVSMRINKIQITKLNFSDKDIQNNYVRPIELTKHLQTLLTWAAQGFNGFLNEKKEKAQYISIGVEPKVAFLGNSLNFQLKFVVEKEKTKINQFQ